MASRKKGAERNREAFRLTMSLDGPYIVEQTIDSHDAEFLLNVPRELRYFKGHFPAVGVLPGVVQIAWVIEVARNVFGLSEGVTGIQALKFQKVILPDENVRLALKYLEDSRTLRFNYRSDRGPCSSGRIQFRL